MAPKGLELILGLHVDPVAGPAVLIGMGGILAELLEDVAVLTPPFTRDDAAAALGGLRAARLFEGVRGAVRRSRRRLWSTRWSPSGSGRSSVPTASPSSRSTRSSSPTTVPRVAVDALVTVIDDVRQPT